MLGSKFWRAGAKFDVRPNGEHSTKQSSPFLTSHQNVCQIWHGWIQLHNHLDRFGPPLFLLGLVPSLPGALLSTGEKQQEFQCVMLLSVNRTPTQKAQNEVSIQIQRIPEGSLSSFVFTVFLLACTTKYIYVTNNSVFSPVEATKDLVVAAVLFAVFKILPLSHTPVHAGFPLCVNRTTTKKHKIQYQVQIIKNVYFPVR